MVKYRNLIERFGIPLWLLLVAIISDVVGWNSEYFPKEHIYIGIAIEIPCFIIFTLMWNDAMKKEP